MNLLHLAVFELSIRYLGEDVKSIVMSAWKIIAFFINVCLAVFVGIPFSIVCKMLKGGKNE